MAAVSRPIDQSVAAPITESQCGSGDLIDAASVLGVEGDLRLSTLRSMSSLSCDLGEGGVMAPDESGNMEQAPFGDGKLSNLRATCATAISCGLHPPRARRPGGIAKLRTHLEQGKAQGQRRPIRSLAHYRISGARRRFDI